MKQAYVVEAGVVVNTIMLDEETDPAEMKAVLGPEEAKVGWRFNGTNWSPPASSVIEGPSLLDLMEAAKRLIEAHVNEVAQALVLCHLGAAASAHRA